MNDTLLFGWNPENITALTNIGLLMVTLIFSAIGSIFAYRQQNPKPDLSLDLISRPNASKGHYQLSIHNSSRKPIHVSALELARESKYLLSADDLNYVVALAPNADIPPGAHAKITFYAKSAHDREKLAGFILDVAWHKNGTATKPKYVGINCQR